MRCSGFVHLSTLSHPAITKHCLTGHFQSEVQTTTQSFSYQFLALWGSTTPKLTHLCFLLLLLLIYPYNHIQFHNSEVPLWNWYIISKPTASWQAGVTNLLISLP